VNPRGQASNPRLKSAAAAATVPRRGRLCGRRLLPCTPPLGPLLPPGANMSERAAKQQKLDLAAMPANVIIQFQSPEGDATGKHRRRRCCVCSSALLGAGIACDVCILVLALTLPPRLGQHCYQILTPSPTPRRPRPPCRAPAGPAP
jgi:hypothetical protein